MFDLPTYLSGLLVMSVFGLCGWMVSVYKKNVTLVDSMWGLFFLIAITAYIANTPITSNRALWLFSIVIIWSVRLSIYLSWRNWQPHEDHRYQEIRKNNAPHFWLKSLYIVFGLQVILAWVISLPLLGAVTSNVQLGLIDWIGFSLWLLGFLWEVVGDWQLARFKSKPANKGKVMRQGLWAFSRHPNYFGEFCMTWAYYAIAFSAGAWWSIPAPLLMTLLLLKISGVALLEKDIAERRPDYVDYIKQTNAFIPWMKKHRGDA